MSTPLLQVSDLQFAWPGQPLLLDIPAFSLQAGERLFLKGPSGSGKTTLLGLLGGVHQPQQGAITLLGQSLRQLSALRRDRFRADHTGYLFQQFNLLPYLSVLDNVTLPCRFSSLRRERALRQQPDLNTAAEHLLRELGLSDATLHQRSAGALSIGQQQRVAAARALIGSPELVIADEPTSALDADSRDAFLKLLFDECAQMGSSLLFVSHDTSLATRFDRALSLAELNRASQPEIL
ncbi:methionine ABC transporter ATP-binding protein [Pseudomonas abyssi]|jgi:putative ABC transport system ATP-binding protein|uniref:Methionine ABC transporter ATP-binding protein n=1 Tax=Pseudomonas abyssi TaxID=170540 RepID=A0A2A3MD45_9PSED|nr:ABC transporter ATP-binding protein [Pseudomonas abyssi]MAC99893.1 ABC transporter ATP-binding protein [Pseudomonadales bacterium]PBK02759.1 methionine ABC transporter ATP-binding protein [Pseudomonas abyssi]|tara:strand:- start:15737 stop:16447 length:711 start_codon:yes stop_codon:yes gene_type:complete